MFKIQRDAASLSALHEQSAELISHAQRLRKEFAELREASKALRLESMQLQEDVRVLRKMTYATFANVE